MRRNAQLFWRTSIGCDNVFYSVHLFALSDSERHLIIFHFFRTATAFTTILCLLVFPTCLIAGVAGKALICEELRKDGVGMSPTLGLRFEELEVVTATFILSGDRYEWAETFSPYEAGTEVIEFSTDIYENKPIFFSVNRKTLAMLKFENSEERSSYQCRRVNPKSFRSEMRKAFRPLRRELKRRVHGNKI